MQHMPTQNIVIQTRGEPLDIPRNCIHLQWVQRTSGWRGPEPCSIGDALKSPEELAEIIECQRHVSKFPDGSPLQQGLFNRCRTLIPEFRQRDLLIAQAGLHGTECHDPPSKVSIGTMRCRTVDANHADPLSSSPHRFNASPASPQARQVVAVGMACSRATGMSL